jgi:hypothetical protein
MSAKVRAALDAMKADDRTMGELTTIIGLGPAPWYMQDDFEPAPVAWSHDHRLPTGQIAPPPWAQPILAPTVLPTT